MKSAAVGCATFYKMWRGVGVGLLGAVRVWRRVEETGFFVRGDDADGLEIGIDDGGADEFHAAFGQIF